MEKAKVKELIEKRIEMTQRHFMEREELWGYLLCMKDLGYITREELNEYSDRC